MKLSAGTVTGRIVLCSPKSAYFDGDNGTIYTIYPHTPLRAKINGNQCNVTGADIFACLPLFAWADALLSVGDWMNTTKQTEWS